MSDEPRDLPPIKREGYPQLPPEHPLYDVYVSGWGGFTREEAWTLALERARPPRADSKSHPAYAEDFIVNDTQAREKADAEAAASIEKPTGAGQPAASAKSPRR